MSRSPIAQPQQPSLRLAAYVFGFIAAMAVALILVAAPVEATQETPADLGAVMWDRPAPVPPRQPRVVGHPGDFLGAVPEDRVIAAEVVVGSNEGQRSGFGPHSTDSDGADIVYATPRELRGMLNSGAATSIRYVPPPHSFAIESEGLALLNSDAWVDTGYTGEGVTIGILDTGFYGFRNFQGEELPPDIRHKSFHKDGLEADDNSHGVAVAEIIHDIAPDADLVLANFFDTDQFQDAVDYLVGEGVDIISMSAGWSRGPFDGSSFQAEVVQGAIDAGVIWINAAGNGATQHYGASYTDFQGRHLFPAGDQMNRFTVKAGSDLDISLTWTDPTADLDLCIYDLRTGVVREITCSRNQQNGPEDPLEEQIVWSNVLTTDFPIGYTIEKRSFAQTRTRIDVFAMGAFNLAHTVAASSIVVPADVEQVITVGAVPWDNADELVAFSGRGPTVDGRIKPDLVGPSSVTTASRSSFGGTSAAAPHVAGVAALRLEAFPGTTPRQMRLDLAAAAISLPLGSGKNADYGWGRVASGSPPVNQDWIGRHDPRTGLWTLSSDGGLLTPFYYGVPGDLPVVCDWDGDGIRTPGLYRPQTGFLYLRNSNDFGVADVEIFFGVPGDLPICGDWNGDGVDTIGIFRPSEARFYLRNSNTQGFAEEEFVFGQPSDLPFAGDWDGDGIDTVGLYRSSNGFVYVSNSNRSGFADIEAFYGRPGDRFVIGDWNDDGKSSFGIYRPADQTFYLANDVERPIAGQAIRMGPSWLNPVSH